jgi:hypothetical protein
MPKKVNGMTKVRRNLYTHESDLEDLKIRNCPRDKFRKRLENIPYRGYRVERISDGREIVITKPGGKFTFGNIKREDFMVWVHNPDNKSLWLLSHKDIYSDLQEKGAKNPVETIRIIKGLEKVCSGQDPENVLSSFTPPLRNPKGELPEVLFKAYKWIWGQEDCNYPNGEGREMSMKGIRELKKELSKRTIQRAQHIRGSVKSKRTNHLRKKGSKQRTPR